MKRTILAGAVVATLLLSPSAAGAAEITIGSDLAAPATAARSDQRDIVWWAGSRAGGAAIDVPVTGQATIMRLKGGTQQPNGGSKSSPNFDLMRFVVLRPQNDGTWRTTVTSSAHRAPVIGAGANENTITEYSSDWPLCVQPGDRIGLVSVGGYDANLFPQGLPYQVFGANPAATMLEFRAQGAIAERETVVRGARVPDTELLLQVVIGTGPDARPTCGGSTSPAPDPPGTALGSVTIPKPDRAPRMFDGKVRLTLRCAAGSRCSGVLSLRARGKRIGRRAYTLDAGESDGVSVTLSRKGRRMARRAGRLRVTARATSGGPRQSRVVIVHA